MKYNKYNDLRTDIKIYINDICKYWDLNTGLQYKSRLQSILEALDWAGRNYNPFNSMVIMYDFDGYKARREINSPESLRLDLSVPYYL